MLATYLHLQHAEFENAKALSGWLLRVVRNARLMRCRRSKFAPTRLVSLSTGPVRGTEAANESFEIANYSNLPDREMLRAKTKSLIERAIESLPIEQRKVLELREVGGMTTRAFAEMLSISEQNVKVRLHRAKTALQMKILDLLTLLQADCWSQADNIPTTRLHSPVVLYAAVNVNHVFRRDIVLKTN